ncbi:hypothetical protein HAX54_046851 [Datura stramonium]|uniref:Secreted protein n=1 Tax=Datura stramonium TaxID=4076 RepID=A0ABS8WLC4_DATST|nr:hypothetical protein [Datura stramonium]
MVMIMMILALGTDSFTIIEGFCLLLNVDLGLPFAVAPSDLQSTSLVCSDRYEAAKYSDEDASVGVTSDNCTVLIDVLLEMWSMPCLCILTGELRLFKFARST